MENIYNNGTLIGRISNHVYTNKKGDKIVGGKVNLAVLSNKRDADGKFITEFFPIHYGPKLASMSMQPIGAPLVVKTELSMENIKDYKHKIPQINCTNVGRAPQTSTLPKKKSSE